MRPLSTNDEMNKPNDNQFYFFIYFHCNYFASRSSYKQRHKTKWKSGIIHSVINYIDLHYDY